MEVKQRYDEVASKMAEVLIGQQAIVRSLFIGLATGGHVLLEGVPGLAKSLSAEAFAKLFDLRSTRIQFTPDLLPSDILGSEVYRPKTGEFSIEKGPIFSNLVIADEINRAPSKVQSALLEAMQERKVSLSWNDLPLPSPFMVVATMNPLEEEGTYRLPEAALDRFLFKTIVEYPSKEEELEILRRLPDLSESNISPILSAEDVLQLRKAVSEVTTDDRLLAYVRDIVTATRPGSSENIEEIAKYLRYGASPRASMCLLKAAKASAAIAGRDYAVPEDVKSVAHDVLRHRIGLTFEASMDNFTPDDAIRIVLSSVSVP